MKHYFIISINKKNVTMSLINNGYECGTFASAKGTIIQYDLNTYYWQPVEVYLIG